MPDRKKIIDAFENCAIENGCVKCAYDGHENCIGLWKKVLALLKEQEPVNPTIYTVYEFADDIPRQRFPWKKFLVCGSCEDPVDPGDKYCHHCGRAIKWEDSDAEVH